VGLFDQVRRVTQVAGERQRSAALALMGASGFAGLGYQIIWTGRSSLLLGHESAAVLAVVSAFFGGLALGGLLLGRRIECSLVPRRWYVACELVIAGWSLVLLGLWGPFSSGVQHLLGVEPSRLWQWSVAFLSTFVLLLPATAAMGATLPAMERLVHPQKAAGRSISALYAANTLGAVLGVLASTFWLIPNLGLGWTSVLCAGLNLGCAALCVQVFPARAAPEPTASTSERAGSERALFALALTGLLGIGYEVLVVRVLSQVTENTVYTFALLLAVYLVGTALGAAAHRRWLEVRPAETTRDALLCALSLACLLGAASLWAAEGSKQALLGLLGAGAPSAVATEAVLGLLAFGLPTIVMGALFSHLCRAAATVGVSFGTAAGVNVLAAAVAPPLYGVLAVPALGAKLSLLLVACGYLAALGRRSWFTPKAWIPLALAGALAFFAPALRFVEIPEGGRIVEYQEGAMAAVSVVEDERGALRLRINNRQQEGSSVTRHVDARQAWLPLLLHPAPAHALFLGLGTGVTAAAASADPNLHLDVVELLPEVIDASRHFSPTLSDAAGRVHLVAADARRYVKVSEQAYDVIVADNFHPARSGSGSLYTVEHFASVRARLAPGGVFCQWLPLHQLDLDTLRSIVRSFVAVYPRAGAVLASNSLETPVLGLVATTESSVFQRRAVQTRLAQPAVIQALAGLALEDEYAVLGSFVSGPRALLRFGATAPLNTDDRPVVAYRAPRVTYAPDSAPRERLLSLLEELSMQVNELFGPTSDPAWERRLSAYWAARQHYLVAGRDVRPAARVEEMLSQVQGPLLAVLSISPDFRPAYDPLFGMAKVLASSDVTTASRLLDELSRLQPRRGEATELLARLAVVAPHATSP
jgi:spermidine synthase